MPYVMESRRYTLDNGGLPENPGDLNYLITKLVVAYMRHKGLSYQTINDIVGALEGAKLEFYEQVARPYEDKKRLENGCVYFPLRRPT